MELIDYTLGGLLEKWAHETLIRSFAAVRYPGIKSRNMLYLQMISQKLPAARYRSTSSERWD